MKIAFISQPEYFSFIYENDLQSLGDVKEFVFNFSMTEKDFSGLIEFDPDISFFFRGEFFPEKVLNLLRGLKVNLSSEPFPNMVEGKINYTLDSLKRYKNFRTIISKPFDYVFHYDKSSIPFIKKDGINLSGEFYFPVASSVYKKINLPKRWDFFFIGRSTAHRERFLGPLKHEYKFLHICHGVWGKELVDYVNQCKICLNIHAENEVSWEPRVQMLMATGNLVISEKITETLYLIPGQDFVEVSSPRELFEKAKYYLEHEDEKEEIALNGMNKIHAFFDSKKIFKKFIEELCAGKYSKLSVTGNQSNLINLEIAARLGYLSTVIKTILRRAL